MKAGVNCKMTMTFSSIKHMYFIQGVCSARNCWLEFDGCVCWIDLLTGVSLLSNDTSPRDKWQDWSYCSCDGMVNSLTLRNPKKGETTCCPCHDDGFPDNKRLMSCKIWSVIGSRTRFCRTSNVCYQGSHSPTPSS